MAAPTTLRRGERVRARVTGAIGTAVWDSEHDLFGTFVPIEWDGPHSLIEDVALEDLERV